MQIDAGQATIITDRCVPPKGLGCGQPTLKSVLWCLRGLGAPGADLCVPTSIIELRTCLSKRSVRMAIAILKEHGILEQIGTPAPGRAARYRMHYERLAEWLQPSDRVDARLKTTGNGCSSRTRTDAAPALERVQDMHAIKSTGAAPAATGAAPAPSGAAPAADIKEETAIPASTSSSSSAQQAEQILAAAAAGGLIFDQGEWVKEAKRVGFDSGLAGQCAHSFIELGINDRTIGIVALERLRERLSSGSVRNPLGLLRTIATRPGGPEPSQKSIKRTQAQERRRNEFIKFIQNQPGDAIGMLQTRTQTLIEGELGAEICSELMPDGKFRFDLINWDQMTDFILARWETIRTMRTAANV